MSRRFPSTSMASRGASRDASPAVSVGSVSRRMESTVSAANSDSASSSIPSVPFMPPGMINSEKLYQAYLEGQQEITTLKRDNQRLRAELADSQLKLDAKGKPRRRNGEVVGEGANGFIAGDIKKLGQNFGLFINPFLDVSIFSAPRPHFASDSPERYDNAQNILAGLTAELYESVPSRYHDVMSLSGGNGTAQSFVKLFRSASSASRSSSLVLLRQVAGQIFHLDPELFTSAVAVSDGAAIPKTPRRDTVPEIQRLIGHHADANGTVSYDRWPPVLCLDNDNSKLENRFLNRHLFMMARVVIFGRSSLKELDKAVSRTSSGYLRTDITPVVTTFGLIAWFSMMARYILSKDERFETSGSTCAGHQTRIPYRADFDYYKRYLIESQAANPTWTDHLLATWDREVFSAQNSAKGLTGEPTEIFDQDDTSEIARDMRMLRLQAKTTAAPESDPPSPIADDSDDLDSQLDEGDDFDMPKRRQTKPTEESEEELEYESEVPDAIDDNVIHPVALLKVHIPQSTFNAAAAPTPATAAAGPSADAAPRKRASTRKTVSSKSPVPGPGPSVDEEVAAQAVPAAPAKRGRGPGRGRGSKKS